MTGLYVHIPFCVHKCKYCDFNSFSGLENLYEDYFLCLEKEILKTAQKGIIFDTVYIGGGTPTAPPNKYLVKLLKKIKNITKDCEITVECNPGTVSLNDLKNLKGAGANRLSVGLQSANDEELKFLGRIHTLAEFEECFNNARLVGFDNISIDIMFGLPNQNLRIFKETLEKAVTYNSEHISCYCLKIEEGTPFAKMQLNLPTDDECADMYEFCTDFLGEYGYNRYEISNFAKNGKISRHNTKYWILDDYIGIGAGAYSFYNDKRFSVISNVKEYINKTLAGKNTIQNLEEITKEEKMSEFMFLGLRMADGISEEKFRIMFGANVDDVYGRQLERFINQGVIKRENGRIFIKAEFLYVSNTILSEFV